jgi:hypothetical protein
MHITRTQQPYLYLASLISLAPNADNFSTAGPDMPCFVISRGPRCTNPSPTAGLLGWGAALLTVAALVVARSCTYRTFRTESLLHRSVH